MVRELLRLAADSGLHGKVIDGRTGHPVPARLEIWRPGESGRRSLSTDPAGWFHRFLLPGTYSVEAQVQGILSGGNHRVEIRADRPAHIELVLSGPR